MTAIGQYTPRTLTRAGYDALTSKLMKWTYVEKHREPMPLPAFKGDWLVMPAWLDEKGEKVIGKWVPHERLDHAWMIFDKFDGRCDLSMNAEGNCLKWQCVLRAKGDPYMTPGGMGDKPELAIVFAALAWLESQGEYCFD